MIKGLWKPELRGPPGTPPPTKASAEETVGAALDVDFSVPSATEVGSMGAAV